MVLWRWVNLKQIIRKLTAFFILIILTNIAPILYVNAADREYHISNYSIDILIEKDGSAMIEERLTYDFDGQFNGILRDVDFSDTKGLIDAKVFVERKEELIEVILNSTNSLADNGFPGTYNYEEKDRIAHFKIFEASLDVIKTFRIRYKLINVVTKYNDIAQFNRKIIDKNWQTTLNNITIRIKIPEGATKDELKVFAHGPLSGESKIVDDQNFLFTVPFVSPGTFVETLVIFPNTLVPRSTNLVNKVALPDILENEGKLADEANKQRENAREQVAKHDKMVKNRAMVRNILVILLGLVWIFLITHIYFKYDKELKHNFQGKYYRELPGDYTPAEMSILLSFGKVHTRDIMATLMDLVRKRQLSIDPDKHIKKGLFGSKEISTYTIHIKEDEQKVDLKKHESYLIEWFIFEIGDGTQVNLEEIKSYAKDRRNAQTFLVDYRKWTKLAKEESDKNKFFDETSKKGILTGVLSGIIYFILGIFISIFLYAPVALILTILGFILLIFSARIKRRTSYGNEQKEMWNAFKEFLKDFSNINKAILPSIVIWEHYLVYAISLGVAKEVIKQLPLVFNDTDLENSHLTFMYGATYGYFAGFNTAFSDTINTVESAISSAVSIANSTNSSSSGGGGGFSGGSSGGGGGGGGGGAF